MNLFFHGQSETTVFLGDGHAEEPQRFHFLHDGIGHAKLFRHLLLSGDQAFFYKAIHQINQLIQNLLITNHAVFP